MAYNYEQKKFILELKLDIEQRQLSKLMYQSDVSIEERYRLINQFNEKNGSMSYQASLALNQSRYKRKRRIETRILDYVLENQASFITLTFRDDVLETTNEKTRRLYVSRFLKTITQKFVANLDYGDKKQREHYHAVVNSNDVPKTWPYGWMDIKIIKGDALSANKISKYVAKLTNHSLKRSGKLKYLIYSRK